MCDNLCSKCGVFPRRNPKDSYCTVCRNRYQRVRSAIQRHGADLNGYKPKIVPEIVPKRRITATPPINPSKGKKVTWKTKS